MKVEILDSIPIKTLQSLIEQIFYLKRLRRQGWIKAGVPLTEVESVAAHTFGVSFLVLVLGPVENQLRKQHRFHELDVNLCLKIALTHDLAEAKYQDLDISLESLIGKESFRKLKSQAEEEAFNQINKEVHEVLGLSVDFSIHSQDTPEKQFVSEIDKLEIIFQGLDYSDRELSSKRVKQLIKEVSQSLQEPKSLVIKEILDKMMLP